MRSRAASRSRCAARATSGASPIATAACPQAPLERGEASDETGTTITFWPNAEIFETVEFDYETLRTRFQQMAFLNKGLRIDLTDERPSATPRGRGRAATLVLQQPHDSFLYERGLVDYVEYLNRARKADVVNDEIIAVESEDTERKIALEVAMQWTTSYTETVHTYANTINTHEGGTHEEGFRAALTTLVNKYAREKSLLKEKDENLSGDDVREGLTAVISVKLSEPQFEGQTKTKLGNTEAKAFVQKVVGDQLGDWFERNPMQAKRHHPQGDPGGDRTPRRAQGARDRPPQGPVRERRHARQAQGLLEQGPVAQRDLPRRGRLGRRLRRAGPQPRDAGDPAAARQDPQRREGAPRPRARQQRDPGDDHGVRRRHRRGLRRRARRGTTRSC